MTHTSIYDIPPAEAERIKREVFNKIREMDAADLAIRQHSYESLAEFVTQIAYEVAAVLGYVIAIPLVWAQNIVESLGTGLADGFSRGLRNQRARPRRRT